MIMSSTSEKQPLLRGSAHPQPPTATANEQGGSKERVWVVAMCALTACLASLGAGMNGGFSSPALVQLEDINSTIITSSQRFNITGSYSNFFGSIGNVGAMFGGLLAWPISDFLGRKQALILGGIPFLSGWILIANSIQITQNRVGFMSVLFIGRILTGFATGWSVFSASVYIAEISSPKYRGIFGNCNQLFMTFGVFLIYFFGGIKLPYYNIALVAAGFAAIFIVLMLFTYETPRWLFMKNKLEHGTEVLQAVRGKQYLIKEEIDDINADLVHMYSVRKQLLEFRHRRVYHPFILVIILMFFQQFSGINIIIFYSGKIFRDAGYGDDRANLISLFAVGLVQVIATLISVALIDHLGRRTLLLASSVGLATSSFLLGVYFYIFDKVCRSSLHHDDCPNNIQYLAIVSVVTFILAFSLGWGPIPWSSMSELLPSQVRTLGAGVATFFNWGLAFIITMTIQGKINPIASWWTFSVIMTVSIIFVYLFLPEAKGRSLDEIRRHFETGNILINPCKCKCMFGSEDRVSMEPTSDFRNTTSVTLQQ